MGALALGIRLLNVRYIGRALGTAQILDAAYYQDVALALLGRQAVPGFSGEVAFANLGYPYFLSCFFSFGASPTSVIVFQAFLGAATAMLVGIVARDLFGEERIGLWAAGLFAFYAPAIFYDGLLLVPSLSAFLAALLAWSLARALRLSSLPMCALAGLAIGLSALLRASQLLLLPLALATITLVRAAPARARWPLFATVFVSTAVCIAPFVVRQRLDSHHWIPLTANSGMNFWIGNHPGASGGYAHAPFLGVSSGGDFQHAIVLERDRFLSEARRRSGSPELSLADADRFWWREAGRAIANAPGEWLRALRRKSLLVANTYESRTNASFDFMEQVSPVLRWDPLRFGVLVILAAFGASELLRSRGDAVDPCARRVLGTLVAVPLFTCLVFFVSGEYRHAAAPALVALGAFGLGRFKALLETWRAKRWTSAWPSYLLTFLSTVLAFIPTERLGPATDRKAYAEVLAMPDSAGHPPTLERYALARELLAHHGASQEERLLSAEALLLVESNQAIQFKDQAAAARLIETSQSLWKDALSQNARLDATTVERIRRNSVRRVAQLCRQPFVQKWPAIQLDLVLLGCHSWDELGALLDRGLFTRAEAMLTRALVSAPHSVEVLAYRGQLELLHGRNPTYWLERSLEGYPRLALPAVLMWQYERAKGDVSRARNYAEEALRREPGNRAVQDLPDLSKLSSLQTDAPESTGLVESRVRALLQEGRHERAVSILQSSVRSGPYDETLRYTLGNLMLAHEPPQALIAFFSQEVERDHKPQTSHYFLALAFERLGQDAAALAELGRALEVDPAHEMSQRQWGLMLERQGLFLPALEHFVEATRIHPEYRSALEDAARVAERLGRHADAERWQARARAANAGTPRRFLYWSRYLHEHGRDSAALVEITRRLSEAPLDEEALALDRVIRTALSTRRN
jgi:tetratricopeptide (TPR) repeat protein